MALSIATAHRSPYSWLQKNPLQLHWCWPQLLGLHYITVPSWHQRHCIPSSWYSCSYLQVNAFPHWSKPPKARRDDFALKCANSNNINLKRITAIQVHELHRSTNRYKPKRLLQRHIIIKLSKNQRQREDTESTKREKRLITYKRILVRL